MASTLMANPAQSPYPTGDQCSFDGENVDLTGGDYTPAAPGRGLLIGAAGAVKYQTLAGHDHTLSGLAVGQIHGIGFKKIYQTGTTATGVVAFS